MLLVGALLFAGCGDDDDSAATTTGVPGVGDPLCPAYVEHLAAVAAAPAEVDASLADVDRALGEVPAEVERAVAILREPTSTVEDAQRSATVLDSHATDRCAGEWAAGVEGASTIDDAAQRFFEALVAGDRRAAAEVATPNVVARFEPWAAVPPDDEAGTPRYEVNGATLRVFVAGAVTASCEIDMARLTRCTFVVEE